MTFEEEFNSLQPPADEHFDRKIKVYGMSNGAFLVNHYWVGHSLLLFPKRFYLWNVVD